MKKLTRIRLINWHYFTDHTLEVQDNLYLFGKNEAGKSSILDALQLVLVADLKRVRFNASAQEQDRKERSGRDLKSYVLCKVGEEYRRTAATAYVALQFADSNGMPFVIGVVIEARVDIPEERAYFILNDQALEDRFFLAPESPRRPYSRREFLTRMRTEPGFTYCPTIEDYQGRLCNRLGQINPARFFDLFVKAFAFKPVGNIRDFVYDYVLDAAPIDVSAMQRTRDELERLETIARRVNEQITALQSLLRMAEQYANAAQRLRLYTCLLARARQEKGQTAWSDHQSQQQAAQATLDALQAEIDAAERDRAQAQTALDEAQTALNQDARHVQRQAWETEMCRLQNIVSTDRAQRERLLIQLRDERRHLHDLLSLWGPAMLMPEQIAPLQILISKIENLPESLAEADFALILQDAHDASRTLSDLARTEKATLEARAAQLRTEVEIARQKLAALQQGKRHLPREAQVLREILTPLLGTPPPHLYELLEVVDQNWQNAVEGLLGRRRFDLLIPPERFLECLRLYERYAEQKQIHGIRLVDTERVLRERRPTPAGSLARQVRTEDPAARAYVDHLLGGWTTCATVQELRQQRRAVTQTCLTYSDYAIDHLDPAIYHDWFIGESGRQRQIERLEAELERLRCDLADLNVPSQEWKQRAQESEPPAVYQHWLAVDLPAVPQWVAHAAELAAVEQRLRDTDWSALATLQQRIKHLQQARDQTTAMLDHLRRQQGQQEQILRMLADRSTILQEELAAADTAVSECEWSQTPEWCWEAQKRYTEIRHEYTPERVLEVYTGQRKGAETQLENLRRELEQQQLNYQRDFNFHARLDAEDVTEYQAELLRLEETELPQRRADIARARQDAELEFREHFIHTLRDRIRQAQHRLEEMNEALKRVIFSGTRYRFISEANPRYQAYYDLIVRQSSELMGMPLLEGMFYEEHRDVIDELFGKLTGSGASGQAEMQELCDYRNYLIYDIELHQDDGRKERFSKVGRAQSGGKTQAPYYVAMVAAFADLYRVRDPRHNDTVRLIVFDEAFNRMDRENTRSALELIRRYQLQVVTATPPDRYDQLVPFMETSILVARLGEQIITTPYYYRVPSPSTPEETP